MRGGCAEKESGPRYARGLRLSAEEMYSRIVDAVDDQVSVIRGTHEANVGTCGKVPLRQVEYFTESRVCGSCNTSGNEVAAVSDSGGGVF